MTNLGVETDAQSASLLNFLLDACDELIVIGRSGPIYVILL